MNPVSHVSRSRVRVGSEWRLPSGVTAVILEVGTRKEDGLPMVQYKRLSDGVVRWAPEYRFFDHCQRMVSLEFIEAMEHAAARRSLVAALRRTRVSNESKQGE